VVRAWLCLFRQFTHACFRWMGLSVTASAVLIRPGLVIPAWRYAQAISFKMIWEGINCLECLFGCGLVLDEVVIGTLHIITMEGGGWYWRSSGIA